MLTRFHLKWLLSLILLFVLLSACTLPQLFRSAPLPARPLPTPTLHAQVSGVTLGDPQALITVEEYVDFQCPVCGSFWRDTLLEFKEKYVKPGQAKLVVYHFPFIGEESLRAAELSECANDQGKFWEYADVLFQNQAGENQGAFAVARLENFAQQLNLDMTQFKACLTDHQHLDQIQVSLDDGNARGINSVPTLFINGQMARGNLSLTELEKYFAPYLP